MSETVHEEQAAEELQLLPEEMPEVRLMKLPTGLLEPNEALESEEPIPELVNAIRSFSLLQPITVSKHEDDHYEVRDGRRRLKAVRKLAAEWESNRSEDDEEGLENPWSAIECKVVDVSTVESQEVLDALMNSTVRPNPLSQLHSIEKMLKKGATLKEITRVTSIPKATIEKRLNLHKLHPDLRQAMEQGKMAVTTAEKAAKLPEVAQKRLSSHLEEEQKITAKDVEEQMRARAQAAATSQTLSGLPDLPGADDIVDEEEAPVDASESTEGNVERLREALDHLRERKEIARHADSKKRPRWSIRDVEAIDVLMEELAQTYRIE